MSVNGIHRDDLAKGQSRYQAAEVVEAIFTGYQITNERSFFVCQNPSFDRAFFSKIVPTYRQDLLHWPYHWLDLASMYWAIRLVSEQSRSEFSLCVSKDAIAKSLSLLPEPKPHRAMNGVRHLLSCYERLVGFPNG
jgi:DNA polymerase-3 subunit epsilon/oligoribonuclease